jgi:cytochrome c2
MKILKVIFFSMAIAGLLFACETDEKQAFSFKVRTDPESIAEGKTLFESKCIVCHNVNNTEMRTGPGLAGILEKSELPVSEKPATPENIKDQLINPYDRMPSFSYLSEEEIQNLVAYLNTL